MLNDHDRSEEVFVWNNRRVMNNWKCAKTSVVVLLTPKETTLLSVFRISTAFRIYFVAMLLSTASTVHSIMLTTDQQQQDEIAACTQADLSSASGYFKYSIFQHKCSKISPSVVICGCILTNFSRVSVDRIPVSN